MLRVIGGVLLGGVCLAGFAGGQEPLTPPQDPVQAKAPENPASKWEEAIREFESEDARQTPPKNGIVFVGSSSIRLWDLPKYFPGLPVINRGFGGSQMSDSVHFADRIVTKHQPRVVVVYAGDNDINAGETPDIVVQDYQAFCARVHRRLPYTRIVYIAIKPSIKRWELVGVMRDANARIRALAEDDLRLEYVDIDQPMLGDDGRPRKELFVKDGLHLSPKGYEIWSDQVRPLLDPEYREAAAARFEAAELKHDGLTLPYRLLRPDRVDADVRYPLVVFLHGAGERGDDNKIQLVHGMPEFASDSIRERYPCFVAAPQCPTEQQWVDAPWTTKELKMPADPSKSMQAVFQLIANLQQEHPIDPRRIYLTGLSMGGFGAWDAAMRKPTLFAAVSPICGGGDVRLAESIAKIPIWAAHGDQDPAVDVNLSRNMIAAIRQAGGDPRYSEYAGVGHHSWVNFYNDPKTYAWMFSQSR